LDTFHIAELNILPYQFTFHLTGMGIADWIES